MVIGGGPVELFAGDEIVAVGTVVSATSTVNALEAGVPSTLDPASVARANAVYAPGPGDAQL